MAVLILVGVAMIVLPGPALVVIPVGLAILATEFVWARRLLERIREQVRRVAPQGAAGGGPRDGEDTSSASKAPCRGSIAGLFQGRPCERGVPFSPRSRGARWSPETA